MGRSEDRRPRILIVDDNLKNIQVLANILKEEGYAIGFATDGLQALEFLKEPDEYDLVLLDIDMPVMDGYQTCGEIRKSEALNTTPIMFITAHNDTENIVKGFKSGAQDYISKPFNAEELIARVSTQINLRKTTRQLNEMNKALEEKVAERTKELKIAYDKISIVEKTKSDFITIISHELRTPLFGLRGFAHLLSETELTPEQNEYLKLLNGSSERLVTFLETAILINQLRLKLYGIEIAKQNINGIIDYAISRLRDGIDNKKIIIKKSDYNIEASLSIDSQLFTRAIESVLDNAIYFSPRGGVVSINYRIAGDDFLIIISDCGPGFAPDALEHLFELFSSSDVMHHSEGFGLGLAAAKLIMDIHSGKITVKNNNGAEVTLSLPFSR